MARELYCRYEQCGFSFGATAGMLPVVCPSCKRTAKWATAPVVARTDAPRVAYALTFNDKRFLRSIHITQEVGA